MYQAQNLNRSKSGLFEAFCSLGFNHKYIEYCVPEVVYCNMRYYLEGFATGNYVGPLIHVADVSEYNRSDVLQIVEYKTDPKLQRCCLFQCRPQLFGVCQSGFSKWLIVYDSQLKFNFSTPLMPEYKTSIGDVLSQVQDTPECYVQHVSNPDLLYDLQLDACLDLTHNEMYALSMLGPGWTLRDLAECGKVTADSFLNEKGITRTNIKSGLLQLDACCRRLIHPFKHRPFTIRELLALQGLQYTPITPRRNYSATIQMIGASTPRKVADYIALQCYYAIRGDWGAADYQASYKGGKWQVEDKAAKQPRLKTFDFTEYAPTEYRE